MKIRNYVDRWRFYKSLEGALSSLKNDAVCYCYYEDEDYLKICKILKDEIKQQKSRKEAEQRELEEMFRRDSEEQTESKSQQTIEDLYKKYDITKEEIDDMEDVEFEDETDLAVAQEADDEYIKGGKKSRPISELWEQLDLVNEANKKEYSTIKFVLRDDLDVESMMELLYLVDFLKFCSKDFYIDSKSEELFTGGCDFLIDHGKKENSNKDFLKLILKKVEGLEEKMTDLKDEIAVVKEIDNEDKLEYKGYLGSIEISEEDKLFYGKVLGVRSLISYDGENATDFVNNFQSAIDDYLEMCEAEGIEPEKAF